MSGVSSGHLLSLAKVTRIESSWGLSFDTNFHETFPNTTFVIFEPLKTCPFLGQYIQSNQEISKCMYVQLQWCWCIVCD